MRVWIQYWQIQCCGDPFRIGQPVRWKAERGGAADGFTCAVVGDEIASTVTHFQEHHAFSDNDVIEIAGTVTAITAVYCAYAKAADGVHYPVPGTAVLRERWEADGWEPDEQDRRFVCYLVDLAEQPTIQG
jgi:hypothetical protein